MSNQELIDELVGSAHGNLARVQEILTEHPELVNASARWSETPIEAAAQMGREDIVAFLLELGAPLDICTAAMLGRVDDLRQALRADPGLVQARGAHDIPLLYYPMIHGRREVAELLVAHGADVNAGDGVLTPLHGVALFDRPDMARWLLDNGAFAGLTDLNGKTPGQVARERGHREVLAILEEVSEDL